MGVQQQCWKQSAHVEAHAPKEVDLNKMLFLTGFIILLGGLAFGAASIGVDPVWIGMCCLVLLSVSLLTSAVSTGGDPAKPVHRK